MTKVESLVCLLTIICLFGIVKPNELIGDGLDNHRRWIQSTKFVIQNKVRETEVHLSITYLNFQSDMWLHKEQSLETLGKNINKTFNHIQRIVDTTMSHGKNAENCLKLAKKELGAIKNEGATIIMKHMNDVEAQFNLACSFMTTFKEAAKTVTNNLDQIFTLCNTEFTIAPNCVIYSWIDIQPQIQGFRNKSVWCTELIDLIMPWMTKSFLAKLTGTLKSATTALDDVVIATEECIKNP
uniref:Venom protein n=1 Tax=Ampulex compressa TaxID=860918 RepID=A0A1W6EVX8_AMPCP|nr:venom protein [Ampulex compressa]